MKYWIMAPYSSEAKRVFDEVWKYDLENNCIAVGWKDLDNVFTPNMTEQEYIDKYNYIYTPRMKRISVHDRNSFWQFWHSIDINDVVVARRGRKTIIGVGRVTRVAYHDQNKGKARVAGLTDSYYSNFIDVKWERKEIRFDDNVFLMATMQQIAEDKYNVLLKGSVPKAMLSEVVWPENSPLDLIEKKKQIIFYGPPGTGKTYHTKKMALNLIENAASPEESKAAPVIAEQSQVWIFQANPTKYYDILAALSDPTYEKEDWLVNQCKNQIKNGDTALIWVSGDKAGIYAVFDIISDPALMNGNEQNKKFWKEDFDESAPRLRVKMKMKQNLIGRPIFREELKGIPGLKDLSILRHFQGTNFSVKESEWLILAKLIDAASQGRGG